MVAEELRERITLHVSKNQPNSRAEYEAFPPEKYPLEIHLLFSKRYGHLVEELKAALDGIPKDKARYKKAENQYTSSVSFRCFFKDTDAMRPFVQQLRGKGLFVEPIQGNPNKFSRRNWLKWQVGRLHRKDGDRQQGNRVVILRLNAPE
ncbi:MAG: hypothetical protein IPN76_31020 [Saprospiraceae bacterium]|nr:hypothetical protein [Saprospiraceae bacterium]